jgi:hypothetical protein
VRGLFIFLLILNISLKATILVVKTSKNIAYKDKITTNNVHLEYVNNVKKFCSPLTKKEVESNLFNAKIYFKKARIVCKKDVYKADNSRLLFDFGTIEIEKLGKIVHETSNYIKIKDNSGKVEKIYKNSILK